MTIGKRIVVTCGILIVAMVLQAVVALIGFAHMQTGIDVMANESVPGIVSSRALVSDIYHLRGNFTRHIITIDPAEMASIERSDDELFRAMRDDMQAFSATARTEEDRAALANVQALTDRFLAEWQTVLPLSRAGKKSEAAAVYLKDTTPIISELNEVLPNLDHRKLAQQSEVSASVTTTVRRSFWLTLVIFIFSTLAGALVAAYIVNGTNRTLRSAVAELGEVAGQISGAASQVASSSEKMAQGSSHQAATIEETSSASTQINSMAQRNTENSRTTAEIVTQSQVRFEETNHSLHQMVEAMDGITSSSQKISKIIKVIDEIAFQTNILALNAAVEAARAGEAGMGFAVVADEVRNLAQRCAQAAQDTANLIDESIQRSHGGKIKVDEVAIAIRVITSESAKMKILVDEINLGSIEQARGIDQISRSISQMEQVTQDAAANAEQGAGAAQRLSTQARTMQEVVERLNALVDGASRSSARIAPEHAVVRAAGARITPTLRTPPRGVRTTFKSSVPFSVSSRVIPAHATLGGKDFSDFPLDDGDFKEF
ncbi:HAMP domain-containing methyl-accepting chemotaxis protein [Granulicella sibirica]|uniref:Methyl-accepting chemotaxis protein I (Serine chemoreceptor protein) n=1 Tax=Granulicella sibirica TaxID=2479048 RepID=A0A4Q0T4G2_9BACT|nr:methyl-accepting chemotaxis protein [Granulicella sibirica]RXH58625.1 Methyl-accepting chemotaxis protein I (serine chemoreceptor protein) [Granulicella sibirica]